MIPYEKRNCVYCETKVEKEEHVLLECPLYNYSRLPLSRNPKDSMKHFEISVLRHIRFEELRKTINPTTTFKYTIFI